MNKCLLLPSHKNTWQKGGSFFLMSHVFELEQYKETCLNQDRDEKEPPSFKKTG